MADDKPLKEITFLPPEVTEQLANAGIHTARQLFHRIQLDPREIRAYLQMPEATFAIMSSSLNQLVTADFPGDALPTVTPKVSKRGVAIDRLGEPSKPRYYSDSDLYVSPGKGHR
jgi:hypothetical protein